MAYGSFFDRRIALIAENENTISKDEIKGVVAHEFAHSKKNHTLILTFITSIDLIIRMIVGFPATYYDYTFGNPQIPFFGFLLINIAIYILIFLFVRYLEGKADLYAKKKGYSRELVKALYNLESFYATGRQIGLNTMLLCDEKINRENQILNYIETAEYLDKSMINPSRLSLMSNILNSHPPTYHRIAAILGDNLTPSKEALLPFILLKKSKIKKYGGKFAIARKKFEKIANQKFSQFFDIENISDFISKLNRKEIFEFDLNQDYLFKNRINNEMIFGTLKNVHFDNNICELDKFVVYDIKKRKEVILNASIYKKTLVKLNGIYFLNRKNPLILRNIEFSKNNKQANFVFIDRDGDLIQKPTKDLKLPLSVNILENFRENDVFLKSNGKIEVFRCLGTRVGENYKDIEIDLMNQNSKNEQSKITLKLKELIIRPRTIYITFGKNKLFQQSEIDLINWLIKNKCRSYIFLKKPVNNLEIGYIISLDNALLKDLKKQHNDQLKVKNIFGNTVDIPYKLIESISFYYKTALIQKKKDTSIFSKLGFKIQKEIKPQKIIYLNKI